MHPASLLDLCVELLRNLLKFEQPADAVVSAFFRKHRALGPRERHTLAETAYAVLRQRLKWQALARGGTGAGERRLALLAWQGSDVYLRGGLSATEQEWLGRARGVKSADLDEAARHNLPPWLAERLQSEVGDEFWALADSLLEPAPLDLRVNALKAKREPMRELLAAEGIEAVPSPYSPWGLRVNGKPGLNRLDAFLKGDIEVQDEGSQLLALLTGAKRGEMVVDFCAGAGGKTLALGAMMRSTGRLYAFDVASHRLEALKPRLARSGLSNVHPVAIAHERDDRVRRLAGKVDRVLVDAPCSGLGTLRRNPDLKWRQSPTSVDELAAKQASILHHASRLLKPGGCLVYATCSLLTQENEAVVEAFGQSDAAFEPLDPAALLAAQGVERSTELVRNGRLRLWPHRHGTDGFFAAVWRRN